MGRPQDIEERNQMEDRVTELRRKSKFQGLTQLEASELETTTYWLTR